MMVEQNQSTYGKGKYDNVYKFNGKELDDVTGMYYYGARYYDPRISIFVSVDPLAEQTMTPYQYCGNNPVMFIDPTGMNHGDYYTKGGVWLGSDGEKDNLVYTADSVSKVKNEDGSTSTVFNNAEKLSISHSEFRMQASTVYGESSAYRSKATTELSQEMGAIAYVHKTNKVAYGENSAQAKLFRNTSLSNQTDKMQLANGAVINSLIGGFDYSYGATNWDGIEQAGFPDSDKRYSTGKWELHKNTIGWKISDEHYNKWQSFAAEKSYPFKAPATSLSVEGTYNRGKRAIKIKGGQTGFKSTAVYGGTIFWKKIR